MITHSTKLRHMLLASAAFGVLSQPAFAQAAAEETLGKGGMDTLYKVSKRLRGF